MKSRKRISVTGVVPLFAFAGAIRRLGNGPGALGFARLVENTGIQTANIDMKMRLGVLLTLLTGCTAALAAPVTVSGPSALALATLIGEHSPLLSQQDKHTLARVFDGHAVTATQTITVQADSIVCRASNVDISARSCELTFGVNKPTLRGRKAHEVFATLVEVGVPSDGAAGTVYESLSQLACTVDLRLLQQHGGGGATCSFKPGP